MEPDLYHQFERLNDLLRRRLGLRHADFRDRLRAARHSLPWRLRGDLKIIRDAAPLLADPRLARRVDHGRVHAALCAVTTELERTPRGSYWRGFALNWAGPLSLVVALGALVWWFALR